MKFAKLLLEHIARCQAAADPCSRDDYVDYRFLKQRIRQGIDEEDFLQLYEKELERLADGLLSGAPQIRDPDYRRINEKALDKISKKFDKRRNTCIRERNWARASEKIGALQLDFEPSSHASSSSSSSGPASGPSDFLVFAAGAASGMTSRTLTAPLDRIKLVLQATDFSAKASADGVVLSLNTEGGHIGRISASFAAIYNDAGWRGFWRGNGANVIKVAPESGVRFLVYDKLRALITSGDPQKEVPERFVAGAFAGGVAQVVVYPLDVCKTRYAISSHVAYRGYADCIQQSLARDGLSGLYKGVAPAVLAILPASGIDLMVYNTLRGSYTKGEMSGILAALLRRLGGGKSTQGATLPGPGGAEEVPIHVALTFGAMSSSCGCVAGYPFTVVRTRLIRGGMTPVPSTHNGWFSWWHCGIEIWRNEGWRGMYSGLLPTMMKTVPAMSIGYGTFETVKRFGHLLTVSR